jgi:hypothetical protein
MRRAGSRLSLSARVAGPRVHTGEDCTPSGKETSVAAARAGRH